MSAPPTARQIACATLTHLTGPAHPTLADLVQSVGPIPALEAIRRSSLPPVAGPASEGRREERVTQLLSQWRAQLAAVPPDAGITAALAAGTGLICPGEPGWPAQLDDLGPARPHALWVRGAADLDSLTRRSVSVAGSRAATAYGRHIAGEMAGDLASAGWTIISGGAYGIDAAAHRGALVADGPTVAVLACGPDIAYPREHASLLGGIVTAGGAVISECPPGSRPDRFRFLARNRLIVALGQGTVIVEASTRSGSLATARHARQLGRPLMAVPGPVTSAVSAGCHDLIRNQDASLVTSAADILDRLATARPAGASG